MALSLQTAHRMGEGKEAALYLFANENPSGARQLPYRLLVIIVVSTWVTACSQTPEFNPRPAARAGSFSRVLATPMRNPRPGTILTGRASWYGPGFEGRRTSSGEVFHGGELTAASTSLPYGSHVKVTNLDNGRSVRLRINDCGPFVDGRKIDVSRRAAERLDFRRAGTAPVRIEVLDTPRYARPCAIPAEWHRREIRSHRRTRRRKTSI